MMDMVYWGASVGISDLEYSMYSYYGESLEKLVCLIFMATILTLRKEMPHGVWKTI